MDGGAGRWVCRDGGQVYGGGVADLAFSFDGSMLGVGVGARVVLIDVEDNEVWGEVEAPGG